MACLGNGILTLFYAPSNNLIQLLESSWDLFEYAQEKGVILHMAQISKYDDYINCIKAGIKGFHLLKPLQEHQVKYQLKFRFNGNTPILVNDDLTADIEDYGGEFGISNIKKINTTLEYDDGLPILLAKDKHPALIVTCNDFNSSDPLYSYYESAGNEIAIVYGAYRGAFTLTVIL